MDSFNPIEWLAWVYGKVFQGHYWGKWIGGVLVVLFSVLGLVLWMRAVDKFEEEHAPKQEAAKVEQSSD